jgi:sugar phosphate isomerase/epimerase
MGNLQTSIVHSLARTTASGSDLPGRIEEGRAHGFRSFACRPDQLPRNPAALVRFLGSRLLRIACVRIPSLSPAVVEGFASRVWLSSSDDEGRTAAVREVRGAAEAASRVGCRAVILRPGHVRVENAPLHHESLLADLRAGRTPQPTPLRDLEARVEEAEAEALDRTCRSLFEICRAHPETKFCLEGASTFHEIPRARHLPLILGDVGAPNLAYWHNPHRSQLLEALGFEPQEMWLDTGEPATAGMTLHDARPGEDILPPGTGEIDFRMLAFYAPGRDWLLLDTKPEWGEEAILESLAFLRREGVIPGGA